MPKKVGFTCIQCGRVGEGYGHDGHPKFCDLACQWAYQKTHGWNNRARRVDGKCRNGHVIEEVGLSKDGRCKACRRLISQSWAKKHPENAKKVKRRATLRLYGLTVDQYDSLYAQQEGHCAICLLFPGVRGLVVDHDHFTGRVRGLLCDACNMGIGHLKDSTSLLHSAIRYLGDAPDEVLKHLG